MRTILSKPRVAVIGAGLTGLSAAYHLRDRAQVVIFEKTRRIGGRVFTSHQPRGEHGAEFLLGGGDKSALFLKRLMKSLKIKRTNEISDWPGYLFHGRFAEGPPEDAAKQLLLPESAKLVVKLLRTPRPRSLPQRKARFSQWLSGKLKSKEDAISFVDMLLRGETCAPLHHLSVKYGLGCLGSLYDSWFRIEGGLETLAIALWEKSRATIQLGVCATEVKKVPKGVQVHGVEEGKPFSEVFQGIIIAVPKGEKLLGKQVKRHFHSYVSFLLEYNSAPRLKIRPNFNLEKGLYTDSPLNYLQVSKPSSALNILRALIPDAGEKVRWSRQDLLKYCVRHLDGIIPNAGGYCIGRVKSWRIGLPCGGARASELYHVHKPSILMAGDRFGPWPSMEAAVQSGAEAARGLKVL